VILSGGRLSRLHSEELRNLYTAINIIKVVISRRVRWAEHVARMGEMTNAYTTLVEDLKGRDHL